MEISEDLEYLLRKASRYARGGHLSGVKRCIEQASLSYSNIPGDAYTLFGDLMLIAEAQQTCQPQNHDECHIGSEKQALYELAMIQARSAREIKDNDGETNCLLIAYEIYKNKIDL